ncbi:vitamin B12 dependent-methionine synthase activation domain-containing protein, partial [uncultured Deinococcus sp.]|uniref:vitamin B12 dependent-methionine synthase activation domain-containing protein n=1 Tax=uncultured Deinococcus sp. TaxID=158789 RepID=UPI00258ECB89
ALRERHGGRQVRLISIAQARERAPQLAAPTPPAPRQPGRQVIEQPIAGLLDYIDWTPFFIAWEMKGIYPNILTDPLRGEEARSLFADAQALLRRVVDEGLMQARGVIGLWPAHREGDDIVLEPLAHAETLDHRTHEAAAGRERLPNRTRLHTLRQQREQGTPNVALADYVAEGADHIGAFAVAIHGAEELARAFEAAHDDYNSILVKAVADRLAEAFAEKLHRDVRRDHWGYAPDETLDNADLIRERYDGIRPAPGYPAQPDHTEKRTLFALLDAGEVGLSLTDSCAMLPAAAVSGLYFAHPEARYFAVGRIGKDQVEDYAVRKGWALEEAERWLGPLLAYDPAAAPPPAEVSISGGAA